MNNKEADQTVPMLRLVFAFIVWLQQSGFLMLGSNISCVEKSRSKSRQGGAQWLSGRVLDSRPNGRWFEPHRRHCVVVLEQDTFILA